MKWIAGAPKQEGKYWARLQRIKVPVILTLFTGEFSKEAMLEFSWFTPTHGLLSVFSNNNSDLQISLKEIIAYLPLEVPEYR